MSGCSKTRAPKTSPLEQLQAARAQLVAQLGSPQAIETPELGRVEMRLAADVQAALAILDSQIAALSGTSGVVVSVIPSSRGLA